MTLSTRLNFLEELAAGELAPADLLNMTEAELEAIERLALSQLATGRFKESARIFAALEASDPLQWQHTVNRAKAEAKAGAIDEALRCLARVIDSDTPLTAEEMVRVLILRASINASTRPDRAKKDLVRAKIFAEQTPEAARVFAEVVR